MAAFFEYPGGTTTTATPSTGFDSWLDDWHEEITSFSNIVRTLPPANWRWWQDWISTWRPLVQLPSLLITASPVMRCLLMFSPIEAARWKRRRYVQALRQDC